MSAVSDVGFDDLVYIATEGRGIMRIWNYWTAPLASYFSRNRPGPSAALATLLSSDGNPVKATAVNVQITSGSGQRVFAATVATDSAGQILIPAALTLSGGEIIHLLFQGTAAVAPSETSFVFSRVDMRIGPRLCVLDPNSQVLPCEKIMFPNTNDLDPHSLGLRAPAWASTATTAWLA